MIRPAFDLPSDEFVSEMVLFCVVVVGIGLFILVKVIFMRILIIFPI